MKKADEMNDEWIDLEPRNPHFCDPKNLSDVKSIALRRSIQAEIATGSREPVGAAVVPLESKVTTKFAPENEEFRQEVRQAAVAKRPAVSQALKIARRKRFPNLCDYTDLNDKENALLRCTRRGSAVAEHQEERLLLHCGDDLVVFSSPRNIFTLKKSEDIIGDGLFKYSPLGTYKIYLLFALVKAIHSPVVTALMKSKEKKSYKKLWITSQYFWGQSP